jgi:hypothetical protein
MDLDKTLPEKAKEKNSYFMEIKEEFSELTSSDKSTLTNLKEVGKFVAEELDSAKE